MSKFYEILDEQKRGRTGFSLHYSTLYSIVVGMEAKNVFEFGSGYSSKTILHALEETGGHLTSCDCRPINESCMHYFKDCKEYEDMSKRWTYIHKDSSALTDMDVDKKFDVVLHDGSHTWKQVYFDLMFIVKKMKKGAILLLHDTNHPTDNYELDRSADMLCSDEGGYHIEKMTLPYGYGLTMMRVIEDFGNGEVELTWRKKK